ncbi:MAG: MerR family transcriptional regulator [Lachnospiraceae bacterium]|jgi:DNA-binding transcriptional MerR regulator|nr:MerR family transcriptional regulator [Lachnospiraceae bacterium]
MAHEYTIGEAAELLNVTRDALRFYEKKELVKPDKKENGYRFYSEDAISVLMDIIFLRKIQCSIQDIQTMYEDGTPQYWQDFLNLRIQEEEDRIRMHQQLLRQLKVSRRNSEKMLLYRNQISVCPMPKTYIISEIMEDFDQVRNEWFQAAGETQGMEHCYIHEQWKPKKDGGYQYLCYLILEEFAVKELQFEERAKALSSFQFKNCLHTVCESLSMSPAKESIGKMHQWAKEKGISLTGEIHSHYLWNYQEAGKFKKSYVEIYMPIEENKP